MELARNLKTETVARLRTAAPLIVQTECTIADAIKLMRQKQVGCLLVCAGKGLAGIVTERDLLTRVFAVCRPLADPIREVMTPDPVTVASGDPIRKALAKMEKTAHSRLPIIDESGRPVGLMSVKVLVRYLAEHFAATIYNLPPDAKYPQHRGGA
ncbi:MAG: cyclic nucleotide-binding/CBS domain-containing protein [Gemmataceae bacterium]